MHALRTTVGRLALCGFAALAYVGCGGDDDDGSPGGGKAGKSSGGKSGRGGAGASGDGASGEAGGGGAGVNGRGSGGSGGNGGTAAGTSSGGSGGEAADAGRGGTAGQAGRTGRGGRAGRAGRGGASGSSGAGVSGAGGIVIEAGSGGQSSGGAGAGGSECAGLPLCEELGAACDGDGIVVCAADEQGCWVASRTECAASEVCHFIPTLGCVLDGSGDTCDDLRIITRDTVISGASFAADFGDQHTFAGAGCAVPSEATPEAVFAVEVPAGVTILVTEVGEIEGDSDTSIDAVFGIQKACTEDAACVTSGAADSYGLTYTAAADETVYAWVSSETNEDGLYRIQIQYLEDFGELPLGGSIPVVDGDALDGSEATNYFLTLSEAGVLYGDLTRESSEGDVDLIVYDEYGSIAGASRSSSGEFAFPDEFFAFPLPAGRYRLEVSASIAVTGYQLNLSVDPLTVLPPFGIGDSVSQTYGAISAGRSEFYQLEPLAAGRWTLLVTNTATGSSGDPDLWGYYEGHAFFQTTYAGPMDGVYVESYYADVILLRVLAYGASGDIPSHRLDLELGPPPPTE